VITVEGETWARFAAKFVRVEPNGDVIFSVRDKRDRSIEEVTLDPIEGQVAYIDDRATPFSSLRTSDRISLYVPEGQYGFTTQPAPKAALATVVVPADTTKTTVTKAPVVTSETAVAQRDSRPAMLPATASALPWLALVGFLAMFGGLGLTLRRWN
jgi:LPXTG-motif cell wall-anchored protein